MARKTRPANLNVVGIDPAKRLQLEQAAAARRLAEKQHKASTPKAARVKSRSATSTSINTSSHNMAISPKPNIACDMTSPISRLKCAVDGAASSVDSNLKVANEEIPAAWDTASTAQPSLTYMSSSADISSNSNAATSADVSSTAPITLPSWGISTVPVSPDTLTSAEVTTTIIPAIPNPSSGVDCETSALFKSTGSRFWTIPALPEVTPATDDFFIGTAFTSNQPQPLKNSSSIETAPVAGYLDTPSTTPAAPMSRYAAQPVACPPSVLAMAGMLENSLAIKVTSIQLVECNTAMGANCRRTPSAGAYDPISAAAAPPAVPGDSTRSSQPGNLVARAFAASCTSKAAGVTSALDASGVGAGVLKGAFFSKSPIGPRGLSRPADAEAPPAASCASRSLFKGVSSRKPSFGMEGLSQAGREASGSGGGSRWESWGRKSSTSSAGSVASHIDAGEEPAAGAEGEGPSGAVTAKMTGAAAQLRRLVGLRLLPGAKKNKENEPSEATSQPPESAIRRTQRSSSSGISGSNNSKGTSGDDCGRDGDGSSPTATASTRGAKQELKRLASKIKIAGTKLTALNFKRGKLPMLGSQRPASGDAVGTGEVEGEEAGEDQEKSAQPASSVMEGQETAAGAAIHGRSFKLGLQAFGRWVEGCFKAPVVVVA